MALIVAFTTMVCVSAVLHIRLAKQVLGVEALKFRQCQPDPVSPALQEERNNVQFVPSISKCHGRR